MWIDDCILRECAQGIAINVFVPDQPLIVLGSSNEAALELFYDRVLADGVAVERRYGGGGAVVLYSGCTVVSLGLWVKRFFENKRYFRLINGALINSIEAAANGKFEVPMSQGGLSDIVIGARKIAGTSMFRSRNYLLYQASILVELDMELITHYLRHPSREPDYRECRPHAGFLRGLSDVVSGMSARSLKKDLDTNLTAAIASSMGDELIEPIENQQSTLLKRAMGDLTPSRN